MPEVKFLLELTREEATIILNAFKILRGFTTFEPNAQTTVGRLCARIVELTTGSESPVKGLLPANHHGPNDPGPESQPDALSPYTARDWKETS